MKDNSGFFIVLMIALMIGVFFSVDLDTTKNTTGNGTSISTGDDTKLTPEEIEEKIKDAEDKVAELNKAIAEAELAKTKSPYFEKIEISDLDTSDNGDVIDEYITLSSDYDLESKISITGWKLRSRLTGTTVTIPAGTNLYLPNGQSQVKNIEIDADQDVYVLSSISPITESFRLNICSGYHTQFYDFVPYISRSCPDPIDDAPKYSYSQENQACLDFIEDMDNCRTQTESLPNFNSSCTEYINLKVNYPSCVDFHKNDKDFYKDEWRVYLGKPSPIWRNSREIIDLLDQDGKIVDTYED